jgi:hypothetical protein
MTLLQRMDRLVYATRLDRIIFMKFQPRTFRWSPLFVIATLIAGYVMMAQITGLPDRSFFIGWLLFYGAFIVAAFLRVFGPRFTATAFHPLDERELMVKARAHASSGIVLAGFAMLGCFYMATAGMPGLWHPHMPNDWINLGFGLQALGLLLPTWIASWLEPQLATDEEG